MFGDIEGGLHPQSQPVKLDEYEILVPVFLRVRVRAQDDLEAEVVAQERIAELDWIDATRRNKPDSQPVHIRVESVIRPLVASVKR